MNCHQVQTNLSVYLYGELDFAQEEEVEAHLADCAFCRQALARDKAWHSALNAERTDVPLDLLSQCRQELKSAIASENGAGHQKTVRSLADTLHAWATSLGFFKSPWSVKLAAASLLVFLGFGLGRFVEQDGIPGGFGLTGASEAGLLGPSTSRVRDIQTGENNQVRIIVEQVRQSEVTGLPEDERVKQLLLAAMRDQADPGIRVDSVELLNGQSGTDVRDALLHTLRTDPNAAVRLKALESLRQFSADNPTRTGLRFVLEHDENPGVRSEAIDVLAPADQNVQLSPELASTLQEVMRSEQNDDYVRMRCLQILKQINAPLDIY